ncbi:hypothetical protein A3715_13965 [Oleiphilus sp. HI0009]|nr:hypothetical protein A3715_13965 [Oleiphilus sp. HI0009]
MYLDEGFSVVLGVSALLLIGYLAIIRTCGGAFYYRKINWLVGLSAIGLTLMYLSVPRLGVEEYYTKHHPNNEITKLYRLAREINDIRAYVDLNAQWGRIIDKQSKNSLEKQISRLDESSEARKAYDSVENKDVITAIDGLSIFKQINKETYQDIEWSYVYIQTNTNGYINRLMLTTWIAFIMLSILLKPKKFSLKLIGLNKDDLLFSRYFTANEMSAYAVMLRGKQITTLKQLRNVHATTFLNIKKWRTKRQYLSNINSDIELYIKQIERISTVIKTVIFIGLSGYIVTESSEFLLVTTLATVVLALRGSYNADNNRGIIKEIINKPEITKGISFLSLYIIGIRHSRLIHHELKKDKSAVLNNLKQSLLKDAKVK